MGGLLVPAMASAADPASQPETPFYSAVAFGAHGDGTTRNTAVIQKAIDNASAAGGGTIYFPAGRYVTGTLVLKDHVTLHVDNGAVLLGSTDLADSPRHSPAFRSWSDRYVNMALVYAENARNIGIVGQGTIDGRGGDPAFAIPSGGNGYLQRPYVIRFVTCSHVRVQGITLRDSPMWMQQYLACDHVFVSGITVQNHVNANNDMIDIDGCTDFCMIGCIGDSDDDAITLKSTGRRASENVTISDCIVSSRCNAIKFGTESTGGFRNVSITNCAVRPSRGARFADAGRRPGLAGIALEIVDGGTLDRVTISNITIEGTTSPIFLRLGDRGRQYIPEAPRPPVGTFRNVILSNIVATGTGPMPSIVAGLPDHPIENVTLRDIKITFIGGGRPQDAGREVPEQPGEYPECKMFGMLPAYGLYCRHVNGLTLDNVRFGFDQPDRRTALVCDDVRNLTVSGLQAQLAESGGTVMFLKDTSRALIERCRAPRNPSGAFLQLAGASTAVSVIGNDLSAIGTPWLPQDAAVGRIFAAANTPPGLGESPAAQPDDRQAKLQRLEHRIWQLQNDVNRLRWDARRR